MARDISLDGFEIDTVDLERERHKRGAEPKHRTDGSLMLDPSLLLTEPGLQWAEEHAGDDIWLPGTFVTQSIESGFAPKATLDFYGSRLEHSADTGRRLKDVVGRCSKYDLTSSTDTGVDFAVAGESVGRILAEEWSFLVSESWVSSRLKKTFSFFVKGGAAVVEIGKKAWVSAVEHTLKLDDVPTPQPLRPGQHLRAITKWIAVGGSAATALVAPPVGVAVAGATGYFLLVDP